MATCYNTHNAWSCSTDACWFPVTCELEAVEHWKGVGNWQGKTRMCMGRVVLGVMRETCCGSSLARCCFYIDSRHRFPALSIPSSLSVLIQNLVPFHKKHAQDVHPNTRICHIVLFEPRMALESIATLFRSYHARKDFKRISI